MSGKSMIDLGVGDEVTVYKRNRGANTFYQTSFLVGREKITAMTKGTLTTESGRVWRRKNGCRHGPPSCSDYYVRVPNDEFEALDAKLRGCSNEERRAIILAERGKALTEEKSCG